MSSSARRIIRSSPANEEDVFVVGETVRRHIPADSPVTTVSDLLEGARRRADHIIAAAQVEADRIVTMANAEATAIREDGRSGGYDDGFEAGRRAAEATAASALNVIESAAHEGLAIRQAMIDEALPTIARAIAMATRRVVGAAYDADPSLLSAAVSDALRSAAGQQILSIRVSPDAIDTLRASLLDAAEYLRPDETVEMGGCLIDVRNGTIDASLDTRLSLMELALRDAGGAA
jgi:flagellar biosynthesis/type III secretory pathway protein FliH